MALIDVPDAVYYSSKDKRPTHCLEFHNRSRRHGGVGIASWNRHSFSAFFFYVCSVCRWLAVVWQRSKHSALAYTLHSVWSNARVGPGTARAGARAYNEGLSLILKVKPQQSQGQSPWSRGAESFLMFERSTKTFAKFATLTVSGKLCIYDKVSRIQLDSHQEYDGN